MAKTRVKTKLKQKVQKNKSHNKSEDLTKLTEDYNAFCTRLEVLVKALVHQHAAMRALIKAKLQVASQFAALSKDTVLFEMTGQAAGADRSTDSVTSYFSIHEGVTSKNNMYADKFKQFVVDYAQEWYKTITDRVGEGLKKAETMRVELDHYQSKVESLRQSANSTMAKGKQVDSKAAEKLTRNEDKLIKIKESSSKFINDLCLLMEEITERSWRDLHPLLIKCSQFETQVSGEECKALVSLHEVVTALKQIASDHGIKDQARLKDLAQLEPHQLSTRSKDDSRNLAIENGFAGMALGGTAKGDGSVYGAITGLDAENNNSYFPPGSTAAQGLGGFPIKVSSDVSNGIGQPPSNLGLGGSSNNSNGAPSTLNMLNIHASAAPAPTMDSMAQAFAGNSTLTPSYGRMASNESIQSDFSGTPAPPPSSAPPPPPPTPTNDGFHSSHPFGASTPTPGFPPSTPTAAANGGGLNGYPHQPMTMTMNGGNFAQQQQQRPSPGGFAQQQSPMGGGNYSQQRPMGGSFASHQQSPMAGNYAQQRPMGGSFPTHQQSPMAGNYAQQRPMGGSFPPHQQSPMAGNFSQQRPMGGSPAPHQPQYAQHATPGHNPFG